MESTHAIKHTRCMVLDRTSLEDASVVGKPYAHACLTMSISISTESVRVHWNKNVCCLMSLLLLCQSSPSKARGNETRCFSLFSAYCHSFLVLPSSFSVSLKDLM